MRYFHVIHKQLTQEKWGTGFQPEHYCNKRRWKVNWFRTMSTFSGKESTESGKTHDIIILIRLTFHVTGPRPAFLVLTVAGEICPQFRYKDNTKISIQRKKSRQIFFSERKILIYIEDTLSVFQNRIELTVNVNTSVDSTICKRFSIATTTGRSNLMIPSWLVGVNLGTTNPLTIGITAENQWVCLFCCQSC